MALTVIKRKGPLKILHVYFDFPPNLPPCDILRLNQAPQRPAGRGWITTEFSTLHLELKHSRDELLNDIHTTTRYEIHRAESRDRLATSIEDWPIPAAIDRFVEFQNRHSEHQKISRSNREYLIQLAAMNSLTVSRISDACGCDVCFHVHIRDQRRARLLLSITRQADEDHGKTLLGRANRLLHWHEICHFKDTGLNCYDFGGLNTRDADPKLRNIAKFKLSFGGQVVTEYKCVKGMTLKGSFAIFVRQNLYGLKEMPAKFRHQLARYFLRSHKTAIVKGK